MMMNVSKTGLAIPQTGNTSLIDVDVQHFDMMGFEVKNTGAQAFDAFIVSGKVHPNGDWITIASSAGDYTGPDGKVIVKSSGNDLVSLAGGQIGWLLLDIRWLHRLKIEASCANVAGTTASLYGIAK